MILGLGSIGEPWAPDVVPFPVGASPTAQAAAATAAAQAAAASSAAKKKAAAAIKAAAAKKPPAPSSSGSGIGGTLAALPWLKIGLVAGGVVGAYLLLKGQQEDGPRENPEDDDVDEGPREAMDFYRDFHWGREPKRVRHVAISPTPSQLVKLGMLEAVTYSAKKGAGKLADYIHHFGEEGGKKPVLAADPRTKRLHVLGGDYDVQSAGIID
jgi:hypothetical protein